MQALITLLVSSLWGLFSQWLNLPLPWMLGPLVGIILWNITGKGEPYWPVYLRNTGLIVLGFLLGAPFTPTTAKYVMAQLPIMLVITLLTVLFSLAAGYLTHRATGTSIASCMLGSVPGGLAQMVLLGEEIQGANATIVTCMQTFRLLAVVLSVPFIVTHGMTGAVAAAPAAVAGSSGVYSPGMIALFGVVCVVSALLATRLKLPTPYMLGPVLGTACLVLMGLQPPTLPQPVVIVAQLFVSIYLGTSIDIKGVRQSRRILPYIFINSVCVLIFSFALGYLLTYLSPVGEVAAFLSTAPGGMAEMGITAMAVNADLSIVMAFQLFRLLFILMIVSVVLKRWLGEPDVG